MGGKAGLVSKSKMSVISALKIESKFSFEGGRIVAYLYAILIRYAVFVLRQGQDMVPCAFTMHVYAIWLRGRVVSFRGIKSDQNGGHPGTCKILLLFFVKLQFCGSHSAVY